MSTENMEKTEYGADQIQILEGLEAVRKRPGMYIGSTSARGLHHLVYEIVDNSVDEALAGYCKNIDVTINPDNSITVIDDGRGIPVGINHKSGLPAVEVVFTVLHAGGKFGGGGYKVSGGLHGVGASVVNALSEWLEVEVYHGGKIYKQRYERGKTMYPLKIVGDCPADKHGTKVSFLPDKEIFEETVYDYDTLKIRLRETAFLTKNLKIILRDDREDKKGKVFHYEGGIKEFVSYLNRSNVPLYDTVIYCEGKKDNVLVEVAMQHNDSYTENIYSFVNNITTPEHPLGVYHPHAKLHHIKKENIGLIEVMGLAVLPSRLKQELFDLADVLMAHLPTAEYPEALQKHAAWAEEILAKHPELNADNVHLILQDEVGHVFAQVLADAGVYKLDEAGRAGFVRFLESV